MHDVDDLVPPSPLPPTRQGRVRTADFTTEDGHAAFYAHGLRWRGYRLFTVHESALVRHLMGRTDDGELAWLSPQGFLSMDPVGVLDDDTLLVATTLGRTFNSLARYHVEARECTWLFEEHWDERALLAARERLLRVENVDGHDRLSLYTWPALTPIPLSDAPQSGVVYDVRLSSDGWTLDAMHESPAATATPFHLDLRSGQCQPRSSRTSDPTTSVRFCGVDGEPLWGRFHPAPEVRSGERSELTPQTTSSGAVIFLQGERHGQERAWHRPLFAALSARGIHVLVPHLRGATGYGLPYARALDRTPGIHATVDLKAAADWLVAEGHAGAGRIAIVGERAGATIVGKALQSGGFCAAVLLDAPAAIDEGPVPSLATDSGDVTRAVDFLRRHLCAP